MAKINNRLKKLKHKPFRRLRADIWGTIGLKNKKNQITKKLKDYLDQDFKFKIRKYPKKKKISCIFYIKEKEIIFSPLYKKKKKIFFQT